VKGAGEDAVVSGGEGESSEGSWWVLLSRGGEGKEVDIGRVDTV